MAFLFWVTFLEPVLGISSSYSRAKKYGGIYRFNFFAQSNDHFITQYNAIQQISKDPTNFSASDGSKPFQATFGKDAMLHTDGEELKATRKAFMPS